MARFPAVSQEVEVNEPHGSGYRKPHRSAPDMWELEGREIVEMIQMD